jgi:hypothetical protein
LAFALNYSLGILFDKNLKIALPIADKPAKLDVTRPSALSSPATERSFGAFERSGGFVFSHQLHFAFSFNFAASIHATSPKPLMAAILTGGPGIIFAPCLHRIGKYLRVQVLLSPRAFFRKHRRS